MTKYPHTIVRVADPHETIRFFELIGMSVVRRMKNEKAAISSFSWRLRRIKERRARLHRRRSSSLITGTAGASSPKPGNSIIRPLDDRTEERAMNICVSQAITTSLGLTIPEQMIERRLNAAGSVVGHKISMLQNLNAARSRTMSIPGDRCPRHSRPGSGPPRQGRNTNYRHGACIGTGTWPAGWTLRRRVSSTITIQGKAYAAEPPLYHPTSGEYQRHRSRFNASCRFPNVATAVRRRTLSVL
jgi:hypothetical protein